MAAATYPVEGMRLMGLEAIYRRPNTSKPAPGHRIFPYLLKGVEVNRVKVWAADITYIPMRASCTWWPSWTGTAGTCWPGSSPTPWSFCVAAGGSPRDDRRFQHRRRSPAFTHVAGAEGSAWMVR